MAHLGKAVSILLKFENEVDAMYDDLKAFHAPGECYRDVEKGLAKRFRTYRRHACRVAGVRNLFQLRKAIKRVCPSWDRYCYYRLGTMFDGYSNFEQ